TVRESATVALMWWNPARRLSEEVPLLGLPEGPSSTAPVTAGDLEDLPESVRRYFRFMGVVDRPRDSSFRAILKGRFRPAKDADWQDITAFQYSSAAPDIARLFYMVLSFYGLPVLGRDTYFRGEERMLVRLLDLVTVQDDRGPEFDVGELGTWLNDAVLLAPSMLLVPGVAFFEAEGTSFDVTVTDRGKSAAARVFVDADGAPTDFVTSDRWYAPPGAKELLRTQWSTPVRNWLDTDGRKLPGEGEAVWKFPDGEMPYAAFRFEPGDVIYNVPPDVEYWRRPSTASVFERIRGKSGSIRWGVER
ncbi:MAG TPA: DUF6544 family protein, partial [Thermoanaerobaculia bacterium]